MGKNTPARQEFIIDNLRLEKDLIISDVLPVSEAEAA